MSNLIIISAIFGWAILTYFAFKINKILGNIFVGVLAVALPTVFGVYKPVDASINFAGLSLEWGFTSFAGLFAWLVVILGALALIFSIPYMNKKDRLGWFYMNFIFSIGAMLGILMSKDFVSLFIFWEIMTWSSYLIVIYNGNEPNKIGIKYMIYSAIGAYAMLMAIVLINHWSGSMDIQNYFNTFTEYTLGAKLLTSLLLLTAFAVKSALMPLHVWAPEAYSNAPMSYTTLFSGALSKMGIYGMGLVAVNLFMHNKMHVAGEVLAWLGAITAVLATFWAIFQNDIRKLLAWSSVGQLGYIAVGLGIGTELSVFAGIYIALLHAMFKGILWMVIGAVEYRTGETDFRNLGGLIKNMPWTFFSALVAIIALAGMPPLPGFVSKWLIYESVIIDGHWLLVIFLFLSSTAAFLYCFHILYGIFLGQPKEEFNDVKEANILMVLPMLLIAGFLIVLGTFPGLIFKPITSAMSTLGFEHVDWWKMSVLTNAWHGQAWLKYMNFTFVAVFVFFFIILTWVNHKRTRRVGPKDIVTAGEPIREGDNFHFSEFFYQPFWRVVSPVMKYRIESFYNRIASGIEEFFQYFRRIYSGNGQTYAFYVVIFLAILLALSSTIF